MHASILEGFGVAVLDEYLQNALYDDVYWNIFFPPKQIPSLDYKSVLGQRGRRVMADVTSHDSPAPQKKRKTVDMLTGEIPPMKVKRQMSSRDMYDYESLLRLGGGSIEEALKLIFDDVDYVVNGIQARLDWLALQALSQTAISLTATNNPTGIITGSNIDFGMPSDNQTIGDITVAGDYWTTANASTNEPITDIEHVLNNTADSLGVQPKYMLMNRTKWLGFRASDQVRNFTRTYEVDGTSFNAAPSVSQVNQALSAQGLPQVVVIDSRVVVEDEAGNQTTIDPWLNSSSEDRYVTFVPDLKVGNMLWTMTAEEMYPPEQVVQSKMDQILVSKYSKIDPVSEWTKAEFNAFPAWESVLDCISLDTESHTTYGA